MTHRHNSRLSREEIHGLTVCQKEKDALKRLQAETAAELEALPHAILDRAFKGELLMKPLKTLPITQANT